ncbi:hypothetical protein DRQ32_11740 [bacterium]|nr:MAG: hypothetical protein DRQ32_11740 [bacterium]
MQTNPQCPFCGCQSKLVTGKEVYPHLPNLANELLFQCAPCDAHVGTHKRKSPTDEPVALGTLADKGTRSYRSKAHAYFDRLWAPEDKFKRFASRTNAYKWLATKLLIPKKACHIGMFDADMCKKAINVVIKEMDR